MTPVFSGSFFTDLFVVEGIDQASALVFLPFVITAIAIGVILAAAYFILWRGIEAKLIRRLYDAGATSAADAKTLAELGYKSGKWEKFLRFLLGSHACMIYKNASCDVLDAQRLAFMRATGEIPSPKDPAAEEDATDPATPAESKKKAPNARVRMQIGPDTKFYILPSRLSYVEEHALKFSSDDYWGLLYTTLGVGVLWFALLLLIDPLIGLFL